MQGIKQASKQTNTCSIQQRNSFKNELILRMQQSKVGNQHPLELMLKNLVLIFFSPILIGSSNYGCKTLSTLPAIALYNGGSE